jgi:hypothetical protein
MIKKFISAVSAIILTASMLTATVFASPEDVFCFDNDTSLTYWSTEGEAAVAATGFKLAIDNDVKYDGAGSLAFSERMTSEAENIGGGAYFTSGSVGVSTLAGATITAKVFPVGEALDFGATITMYSDGEVYIPTTITNLKADTWQEITLKIPSNCNNTKIGFNIPLNRIYNGTVFYVDDLKITQANNSVVPNIGDSQEPVETPFHSLSTFEQILMIGGLVIIVAAVIIFIIVTVVKSRKKYR